MRLRPDLGESGPSITTARDRLRRDLSTVTHCDEPLAIDTAAARFVRLQKNIGVAAKLHMQEWQGRRCNIVMVTLTYRPGCNWDPAHLTAYMTHVRNWYKRQTGDRLRYVWVAEVQDGSRRADGVGRGVIHYHVILWVPKRLMVPKADKRGWWPHGMTKTERATQPVAYVMSYAKKLKSKEGLPHGARVFGVGGLDDAARGVRRWLNLPSFLQARFAVTDRVSPQVGGGWVDRATGELWPAEWGFSHRQGGFTVLRRLRDHGRPLANVVGPFSWASVGHREDVHEAARAARAAARGVELTA